VRDFVVVGAGIAGLTLAYELTLRGAGVTVVDTAAEVGGAVAAAGPVAGPAAAAWPLGAASAVPAALLNPHRGRTARARPSDLAGLAAFGRLARRLADEGLDPGWHPTGVLRVASTARQAALWRELVRLSEGLRRPAGAEGEPGPADGEGEEERDEGPRWLSPDEVPTGVAAPHGALLVPRGGWVEPAALLRALAAAAARRGAELLLGVRFTGIERVGAEVVLATDAGPLRARHAVLCPGASPAPPGCRLPRLAADGGVAAVLRPSTGEAGRLARLPPLAGAVNAVFARGLAYVSGGTLPPVALPEEALRATALNLRDAAAWAVPALASAEVESVWFGVRARRASGRPVVRRLSPAVSYYGALAGRGFLCAADLSARLAERLVGA